MNLLLLGGASPRNKPWLHEVEKALAPLFGKCLMHEYAHWNDPNKTMDIRRELEAVSEKMEGFGKYIIFAKSAGTLVALKGAATSALDPKACLFAGLPLSLIKKEGLAADTLLRSNEAPTIIVQNTSDPVGSFADVKTYTLDSPANYRLIETPGDTHSYDDLQKLKELAASLI